MNTSGYANHLFNVEWSLHIDDAGAPPSMAATALWLFVSFCVAALFLVVRPAATQQLRERAESSSGAVRPKIVVVEGSAYAAFMWRLLAAVWALPLYDAIHRTCCYLHLTPYMLARHQMLPLGVSLLWDGLWTEWVNWVRLYLLCGSSLSPSIVTRSTGDGAVAASTSDACDTWQLPLTGVLPFQQYPEYAALNTSRLPSQTEVELYHQMSLEALAITAVAVVQLFSLYSVLRHVFCAHTPSSATHFEDDARGSRDEADDAAASSTEIPRVTLKECGASAAPNLKRSATDFATSLHPTDAPGDDAWVDSPEALAEEEAHRLHDDGCPPDNVVGMSRRASTGFTRSPTTRLLQHCWPSLVSVSYAAMYAYVGGLPLLMSIVFPCAVVIVCVLIMFTPA
jgi:hypothetical protein